MKTNEFTNAARITGPEIVLEWRTEMGLSQRDASKELGWARGSLGPAERTEGAPKYIGLAMSASILEIPCYGTEDWVRWRKRNKEALSQLVPISKMRNRNGAGK